MTDRLTVVMVVTFLGVSTLVGLGGLIWLVGRLEVKDAALLAIIAGPTGTALGALGTLLASTRTGPMPVTGIAGGTDPVETHEVGHE